MFEKIKSFANNSSCWRYQKYQRYPDIRNEMRLLYLDKISNLKNQILEIFELRPRLKRYEKIKFLVEGIFIDEKHAYFCDISEESSILKKCIWDGNFNLIRVIRELENAYTFLDTTPF
jgi:hypothetical protein